MKLKGLLIILFSVMITLGLWLGSKWFYNDWFIDNYKYLSKTSSLTAIILFSWSMILSARFKTIENLFGGLDKVYTAHKWLGIFGFCLILLHPIFLALHNLPNTAKFVAYFGLYEFDSIQNAGFNFGIAAIALLISLILMIQNNKIPYHIWKKSHEFMTLFYIVGVLHILLVTADISKYPLLAIWMYSWFIYATFCGIYIKFLYPIFGPCFEYTITQIEKYEDMIEIKLTPNSSKVLRHKPGQFAFVKFQSLGFDSQSHPYSIACAPNPEGTIMFGIKVLGDDTKNILSLEVGEKALIYGPYGNLGEKFLRGDKDCVCIGGGIGVTPFLSIWDAALNHENTNNGIKYSKVHLFYSVKSEAEAICDDNIRNSMIQSHISCDTDCILRGHSYTLYNVQRDGFLTIEKIQDKIGDLKNKYFLLCGPKVMTDSLIKQLKDKGVKNTQIVLENFDMRHVNLNWLFDIIGLNK
ncbi:MAG: ferric reductase-like transmembrane domain-containing protein [candidate division SR1 bacterium]|nr:ferric reductase-like transmembrane domain-containing protein [candidate division SR1 bacterium]